jgi:hypothetical protein
MGRILRVDFSALPSDASEARVAAGLLGECARSCGRGVAIEVENALRGADVSVLTPCGIYSFDNSADAADNDAIDTSGADAATGAADTSDRWPPALVINFDEARLLQPHRLSDSEVPPARLRAPAPRMAKCAAGSPRRRERHLH